MLEAIQDRNRFSLATLETVLNELRWNSETDHKTLTLILRPPSGQVHTAVVVENDAPFQWVLDPSTPNGVCTPVKIFHARGVKPGDRWRTKFKGTLCGDTTTSTELAAGVIMADIDGDSNNNCTDFQRPPAFSGAEADAEEYHEQAPFTASGREPGLLVPVNRGYEEAGVDTAGKKVEDKDNPGIGKKEADGSVSLADPDIVRSDIAFKLPSGVSGHGVVNYDTSRIKFYLVKDGHFALVPSGLSLPIADEPSISPGTLGSSEGSVSAYGRENHLYIEGLQPSPKSGDDQITITLVPDNGDKSSSDSLHYTVIDVRYIRATDDQRTRVLNVSNYETSKVFGDDAKKDEDNFRVEVEDASAQTDVISADLVELEALKPKPDEPSFDPPRKINLKLTRESGTNLFHSRYLRLVVDEKDHAAFADRTLLTDTDLKEDGSGDTSIDILGQIARVTYKSPSSPNHVVSCRARATVGDIDHLTASTSDDPKRFASSATYLSTAAGADPDKMKRGLFRWLSRVYAQADLAPLKFSDLTVTPITPPNNLVTINFSRHREERARGGKTATITVLKGGSPVVASAGTTAGMTPEQVAQALVQQLQTQGVSAKVFVNPFLWRNANPDYVKSADLLIDGATVMQATSTDLSVDLDFFKGDLLTDIQSGSQSAPGSIEVWTSSLGARVVLRNASQSGSGSMIRYFLVKSIKSPSGLGQGFSHPRCLWLKPDWRPQDGIFDTSFEKIELLTPASDHNPFVVAHESGHILLDNTHVESTHDDTEGQMMVEGGNAFDAGHNTVRGPKRIADQPMHFVTLQIPSGTATSDPMNPVNQVAVMRSQFAQLLRDF